MNRIEPVIEPRFTKRGDRLTHLPNDHMIYSTWSHRIWLAIGCTIVSISLAKAIFGAVASRTWFRPLLAGYIGYILADLVSGFYHWAIDNYGDASTPFLGETIKGFQNHHTAPWIITQTQMANKLHALAQAVTVVELPFIIYSSGFVVHALVGTFAICSLFSQELHSWSHEPKSKLPRLVVMLQNSGMLLSRSEHAAHHKPPFNKHYCIVSGICNGFLDKGRVFVALETVVFHLLGVKPRSWNEPRDEWPERAYK